MPLKKLLLKAGVNREKTRYTNENGWYECDKVRFRQGFPEKIGGWQRLSAATFQGVCRSLWSWVTLTGSKIIGVGTHLKFYLEVGGLYYDITPLRSTTTNTTTFAATNGSAIITATDNSHGALVGDFVTFSSAVSLGGVITATVLNAEYQITAVPTVNTYTFTASVAANGSDSGNGGAATDAAYQIHVGSSIALPLTGWGGGAWSAGTWGNGGVTPANLRVWSQSNFGEDTIFGPRGGGIYFWDVDTGLATRAVALSGTDVPSVQNFLLVSDISRFVFAFGANTINTVVQDPLLVRWSDQEDANDWTPSATNQSGSLRLSRGTEIVTAAQSRQEVLVWTDSSLYTFKYLGGPDVWGAQLIGDNISIASQNATAYANGVTYWMGKDKFYMYDGRMQSLPCDLRRFVFNDFNTEQFAQVAAGTIESYHEVWWFYCSASVTEIDRYVVYNYLEKVWYYGTMGRTAWLDSGTRDFPLAATYTYNLVNHEEGVDDNETGTVTAINAHITSAEFDVDDGHRFSFVWRILPDVTFEGSTASSPAATMTLYPLKNSGSGYSSPASVGGSSSESVTRTAVVPIEAFTGQVATRVRGRQMAIKMESTAVGVQWQLGAPRIDIRPDGRR